MNRILFAVFSMAVFVSCAGYSYQISGTADGANLGDNQQLFLRTIEGDKAIDSCEVVHGKFHFTGSRDSVAMAIMFINNNSGGVPVILEEGDISVKIGPRIPTLQGTYYNEQLSVFLKSHDSLEYQFEQLQGKMEELPHLHSQAIMDGLDMVQVERDLMQKSRDIEMEAMKVTQKMDSLVTGFIVNNADNVLGPGIFYLATRNYPYQVMMPWIVEVMSKTGDTFKSHPYVKHYLSEADMNQRRELGLDTAPVNGMNNNPAPVQ